MLRGHDTFTHDICESSYVVSHLCLEIVDIRFSWHCGSLCRIHNIQVPTKDRKEGRRATRSRDLEATLVLKEVTSKRR